MKKVIFFLYVVFTSVTSFSQGAPNLINSVSFSPTTEKASKLSSVPVNVFTGVPNVSVPIYSYAGLNNGLSLNIDLSYFAGGTQVAESPTIVGLGWFLNAGGMISRTVRGLPDDYPQYGYMYASSIPTDFRSNGTKYYYDSLDSQQDVFQFSFNGKSGKFYIGKNNQIVTTPLSKLKVIPTIGYAIPTNEQRIVSFRIVTEDGVKYDFKDAEQTTIYGGSTSIFNSGNSGVNCYSAWYLSQIISPFYTDTIKFTYTERELSNSVGFPQVTFVRNSDGVRTATYSPTGSSYSRVQKISSISFPDKTNVNFVYSNVYNYSSSDKALSKIKISDTTFRYGYSLDYQTLINNGTTYYTRLLLKSVTPYTAKEKQKEYYFSYNIPLFPLNGSTGDTIQNKRDHWGFYNSANNGTNLIPQVNNYSWGADRNPVYSSAVANLLDFFYLPGGGAIHYEYELNDHYPYTKSTQSISIAASTPSQNNINLNQVFGNKHQIMFVLDNAVSRQGSSPISGSGNLLCYIKSTDGSVIYAFTSISLYDLFYQGMKAWTFNLANGSYKLETQVSSGTSITGSFPINISCENRTVDASKNAVLAGGLRVKRVTRYNAYDDVLMNASIEEYKYITEDSKSSGFLGEVPKYDYPYQETVNYNGTTTTNYTVVSSEPVNNMSYAQGSPVGYGRVEVIEGTSSHNLGKKVYEFSGLQDVNSNIATSVFPYTPQDIRDWGIGLPKRVSIYDSSGNLVRRTVNTIAYDTMLYENNNFKSIKLGHSATIINGDPSNSASPKIKTYIGQEYYPTSGRAYVTKSVDSTYHSSGTVKVTTKSFVYDTSFNISKVISDYDKSRGLQVEQRFYYPYNYTIGGGIGKLRDSSIITTVVAIESWITGDSNPRIIAAEMKSLRQLSEGYIMPDTMYTFESNKPIPQATIGVFDASKLNRNVTYFKPQLFFSGYDSKANLIESTNLNSGKKSSIIIDYGKQYPIATVSNASTSDIAYSSFESDGSGNWTIGSAARDISSALTGKQSYNLSNGNVSKSGLNSSQSYYLTIWAKNGATVNVNGSSVSTAIAQQNNWNLYSILQTGITTITISGSGLVDEVRLHPKDANMTTSTFEPMVGTTSMSDANNTVIYKEYDNLLRIKLIRDKDKNILKRYDYSDTTMFVSTKANWTFTTGGCDDGINGVFDSVFTDSNPYSDSYQSTLIRSDTNYCGSCASPASYPMYKLVNGQCELGTRVNTSTTYMKINNPNGSDPAQIWVWRCIWRYQWSDSSVSSDYTEYNDSPCSLLGGGGGD